MLVLAVIVAKKIITFIRWTCKCSISHDASVRCVQWHLGKVGFLSLSQSSGECLKKLLTHLARSHQSSSHTELTQTWLVQWMRSGTSNSEDMFRSPHEKDLTSFNVIFASDIVFDRDQCWIWGLLLFHLPWTSTTKQMKIIRNKGGAGGAWMLLKVLHHLVFAQYCKTLYHINGGVVNEMYHVDVSCVSIFDCGVWWHVGRIEGCFCICSNIFFYSNNCKSELSRLHLQSFLPGLAWFVCSLTRTLVEPEESEVPHHASSGPTILIKEVLVRHFEVHHFSFRRDGTLRI